MPFAIADFSALGRAVWDETYSLTPWRPVLIDFSALGRAVWDETGIGDCLRPLSPRYFSALGRAVWDETSQTEIVLSGLYGFQCSRSSRMG